MKARLLAAYDASGLTQEQFAERAGVGQSSVQRWLAGGVIRPNRIGRVAAVLGVSEAWLIAGVDAPNAPGVSVEARAQALAYRAMADWALSKARELEAPATSPGAEIQAVGRQVEAAIEKAGKGPKQPRPAAAPRRARGRE